MMAAHASDDGSEPQSPAYLGNDAMHPFANGVSALDAKNGSVPTRPDEPKKPSNRSTPESDASFATMALQFLSTASPTTLASVAVGFAAVVYLLLGQLGLLLIGAFSGVAAFVSWEAQHPEVARIVHGESGFDILERLGIGSHRDEADCSDSHKDDEDQVLARNFDDFQPETREALSGLVDAVIRDYVKWWYSPIIPSDHSFPLACRKTLTSYLIGISTHLSRKRPADMFLDLLTNSSSMTIVFMSELAAAFADLPPDSNVSARDAIYNYLASNPDSRLASLLNQRQQSVKFKMVAEDMLGFLEKNSYKCDPARVFLREILANSVLENTLQRCSKAEWINGWIVYLLEQGEPDLSQAIDVGMQTGRDTGLNVFADLDGNVGNVGIAKSARAAGDDKNRRKDSPTHKKKLSKAEEELEEAMEEMKRMNEMIARNDALRKKSQANTSDTTNAIPAQELATALDRKEKPQETPLGEMPQALDDINGKPSRASSSIDGYSARSGISHTPVNSVSTLDTSSIGSSPRQSGSQPFTSFDQIVPPAQRDEEDEPPAKKGPLTLHNATFTLHDDSAGDKSRIWSKPTGDYLIQVEPSSPHYSGWMIVRRYADFETLHEILRRIATISGATAFTEVHKDLPSWKVHTRESLRGELERYLRDACWYQSLAESEGMKRFLEKSQGHTHSNSKSFGWETVGKNMLDVLTIAPKGAMEGGKTIVGGVSGVLGNIPGLNRRSTAMSVDLTSAQSRLPSAAPRMESMKSPARSERPSMDSQRSSVISTQPGLMAPMDRRPSYQSQGEADGENTRVGRGERMDSVSASARASREHSRASSIAPIRSPSLPNLDQMKLPPHPDEIDSDYDPSRSTGDLHMRTKEGIASRDPSRTHSPANVSSSELNGAKKVTPKAPQQYTQLSEQETRVAVELLFAVITEMYSLSSAWNIRRTLLAAAKSFLLRPGNPSLLTVQSLMQSSVLDANASDASIAAHLRKLRQNTMPTEQELAEWPAELTADEKEKLAIKARKLLIQSGVPAALMGVMGQSATGEALGRVFDCLQIEEVARGLIFGLMLQAVRIITH
ncbi:hypothetical protein HJFPF1_03724 [Paramyrothecium foliicola]|nr:hypothetical protein HJFPF1_03724 [Paramyrothecium foliicola]